MVVFAKSSTEYYKQKAKEYLNKTDNTLDPAKYMYYYDEAVWWLFLYNESKRI